MNSSIFILVLLTAAFHAGWNFFAKKVSGNLWVIWVGLGLSSGLSVAAIAASSGFPPAAALPIPQILASGVIHTLYFIALGKAYEKGDLSVVYPIARGIGVASTALAAAVLLREQLSLAGICGIMAVVVGTAVISRAQITKLRLFEIALIGGIGLSNAAAGIVDKSAVATTVPHVYISLLFGAAFLGLTPYVVFRFRGQTRRLVEQYGRYAIFVGPAAMLTYWLVLLAFQRERISYVSAVRESTVVMAAFLGVVFLNESISRAKGWGIACILMGIMLIRLG